jgi:predicted Na+-dependent transporter
MDVKDFLKPSLVKLSVFVALLAITFGIPVFFSSSPQFIPVIGPLLYWCYLVPWFSCGTTYSGMEIVGVCTPPYLCWALSAIYFYILACVIGYLIGMRKPARASPASPGTPAKSS